MTLQIADVIATFDMLDAWEDRYRYLIEMGRSLAPLSDDERNEDNRVRGCASQVWVVTTLTQAPDGTPLLAFRGDSDAHIVKGLVALVLSFYDKKTPQEVLSGDVMGLFKQLELSEHLTPQRSNGVRSMVERIRRDAAGALAAQ
ncbi:MAG: SufE family protein [Rhizobiales bacterium]|jgi:cysteine desulfuration protein SufE|nr:SufE family protein [Hyphomicrobiales bacterium]